jgi:hypothetical protein
MIFDSDKEKKAAYRTVFNSILGRRVLADIADRLGLWDMKQQTNITSQSQVEMMLIAKHILSDAGVWREIYGNTLILKRKGSDERHSWFGRLFRR